MTRYAKICVVLLSLVGAAACKDDGETGTPGPCNAGATRGCFCTGGHQGSQTCQEQGVWGSCTGCSTVTEDWGARADGELTDDAWVTIPAGKFWMGSPANETCRQDNEDRHEVTLTNDFAIQRTEVTQDQFQALMGYNPSHFAACGGDCPVENVSWSMAAAYCNALSVQNGLPTCYNCSGDGVNVSCKPGLQCSGYRLPTEAEWEYAYRAGSQSAFYSGDADEDHEVCGSCTAKDVNADRIGWYTANDVASYADCEPLADCGCVGPQPVGQKAANGWFLHDMAGNVFEWCHDWYTKKLGLNKQSNPVGTDSASGERVCRGGAYRSSSRELRAASRGHLKDGQYRWIGFRCAGPDHLPGPGATFDCGTEQCSAGIQVCAVSGPPEFLGACVGVPPGCATDRTCACIKPCKAGESCYKFNDTMFQCSAP